MNRHKKKEKGAPVIFGGGRKTGTNLGDAWTRYKLGGNGGVYMEDLQLDGINKGRHNGPRGQYGSYMVIVTGGFNYRKLRGGSTVNLEITKVSGNLALGRSIKEVPTL